MPNKNVELSKKVAKEIDAQKHQCWNNSVMAVYILDDILHGAVYVEGWIVYIVPIEHGWIELTDGTIVDPTIPEAIDVLYFAGVKYSREEIETRLEENGEIRPPFVYEHGFGGFKCESYLSAYNTAFSHIDYTRG